MYRMHLMDIEFYRCACTHARTCWDQGNYSRLAAGFRRSQYSRRWRLAVHALAKLYATEVLIATHWKLHQQMRLRIPHSNRQHGRYTARITLHDALPPRSGRMSLLDVPREHFSPATNVIKLYKLAEDTAIDSRLVSKKGSK